MYWGPSPFSFLRKAKTIRGGGKKETISPFEKQKKQKKNPHFFIFFLKKKIPQTPVGGGKK